MHRSDLVLQDCCTEENQLQLLKHSPCLLAAAANENGNLWIVTQVYSAGQTVPRLRSRRRIRRQQSVVEGDTIFVVWGGATPRHWIAGRRLSKRRCLLHMQSRNIRQEHSAYISALLKWKHCIFRNVGRRLLSDTTRWTESYMEMSKISGYVQDIWTFTRYVNMYKICRHVQDMWSCTRYVGMYKIRGHVQDIWTCTRYVGMYKICGHVQNMRTCTRHVDMYVIQKFQWRLRRMIRV